jgi:hypothetical protein
VPQRVEDRLNRIDKPRRDATEASIARVVQMSTRSASAASPTERERTAKPVLPRSMIRAASKSRTVLGKISKAALDVRLQHSKLLKLKRTLLLPVAQYFAYDFAARCVIATLDSAFDYVGHIGRHRGRHAFDSGQRHSRG